MGAVCFGAGQAETRLYAAGALGEIQDRPADDMGGTGPQAQIGASAEYLKGYALVFAQPWIGYYTRGPLLEGVAGAGAGIPIPLIRGHAWFLAEAVLRSVNVPRFTNGTLDPERKTFGTWGLGARLDAWRFYASCVGFEDLYPNWRVELGFRIE